MLTTIEIPQPPDGDYPMPAQQEYMEVHGLRRRGW